MSNKNLKCTPHFVSRNTQFKPNIENVNRTLKYDVTEQVFDEVTQCVTLQSTTKIYDPYASDDYRCSDFAMENLIAVGKTLSPSHLAGDTSISQYNIEATLENLQKENN